MTNSEFFKTYLFLTVGHGNQFCYSLIIVIKLIVLNKYLRIHSLAYLRPLSMNNTCVNIL